MNNFDALRGIGVSQEIERQMRALNSVPIVSQMAATTAKMQDLLAMADLSRFRINSPLLEMTQYAPSWAQVAGMTPKGIFDTSFFAGLAVKNHALYSAVTFPESILAQVGSIFDSSRKISDLLGSIDRVKWMAAPAFAKSGLQYSLATFSSAITAHAAIRNDQGFLERFGAINSQALSLSEEAIENNLTVPEYEESVYTFIGNALAELRVEIANDRTAEGKTFKARLYEWMNVLGFILAIVGLPSVDTLLFQNKDAITRQDMQAFKRQLDRQSEMIQALMKPEQRKEEQIWVTNRKCAVHCDPKMKSIVLGTVDELSSVKVITTNHEWQYITYTDPKDDLPKAGWVMKKYLGRVK